MLFRFISYDHFL